MNISMQKIKGFTLIEMMLVLVIASSIIIMGLNLTEQKMDQLRRERTAITMQSILNAAASYYVANSVWPTSLSTLQPAYLPAGTFYDAWRDTISISTTTGNAFTVSVTVATPITAKNTANALIIAGMLPLGAVSGTNNTTVTGRINIPGQNLNNALAINYGAVYYDGACVPAPACPNGMSPNIMVIPVAAAGVQGTGPTCTNATDPSSCSQVTTSPINSFTAFYRGASTSSSLPTSSSPLDCEIENTPVAVACDLGSNAAADNAVTPAVLYWRVCLAIATQSGLSYPASSDTMPYNEGKLRGNILAITRCMPTNGDVPAGSSAVTPATGWSVFTPNSGWNK